VCVKRHWRDVVLRTRCRRCRGDRRYGGGLLCAGHWGAVANRGLARQCVSLGGAHTGRCFGEEWLFDEARLPPLALDPLVTAAFDPDASMVVRVEVNFPVGALAADG